MSHKAVAIIGAVFVILAVICAFIIIAADIYVTYLLTGYDPFYYSYMYLLKLYDRIPMYYADPTAYHQADNV